MRWIVGAVCTTHLLYGALAQQSSSLPVVDLGYEVHQASSLNETGQTYNFSNIRFAQSPVGNLRWAAPVPPAGRNSSVTTGPDPAPVCPQANPAWYLIGTQFLEALVNGTGAAGFNFAAAQAAEQAYLASGAASSTTTPGISEDCLFLDVISPKSVFDNAHSRVKRGLPYAGAGGAPVLVWIYGGGYTGGSKRSSGNPSGLIKASQQAGGQGIIFVAMNYRLGALGFMAGPTLQGAGGVANAAFYDQRLAIDWVSKYIHLFGGDPQKVTVMGESAGGGSVMHQITAFGGQRPVSFQRAIPQSPAFLPNFSPSTQDNVTANFLALLNVSTIAQARNLSSAAVIKANAQQIASAPYGEYYYGPAVDGVFVPELPGLLLNAGAFAKDIQLMSGHNTNESPFFTNPTVTTDALLEGLLKQNYPEASQTTLDYIVTSLYPADYSGRYPWRSPLAREMTIIQDSSFTCNNNYLNRAFNNQSWAYEFQVPPAFHGFDVPYTFYNGPRNPNITLSGTTVVPIALALQGYITNFVSNGDPNGPGLPPFPIQGMNASMNGINITGIVPQQDPTVNARCVWWQKAQYY